MASTQLTPVLAKASAATSRGLKALVGLANALGTLEKMPEAREEAEEAAAEAEEALRRLNQVLAAALATKAAEEPGLGARSIYSAVEAFTKARVEELEREQKRNRRQQKLLVVLRNVALGLLLLCTPLLSFDAVREALGVTQEGHLVPCLATVLLVCQVAAWASERSGHHLATALDQQRHQLAHYRHLAHATPPPMSPKPPGRPRWPKGRWRRWPTSCGSYWEHWRTTCRTPAASPPPPAPWGQPRWPWGR